jgi:hypothetical protein
MNQKQIDKFKMFKACLNKLNSFGAVWAGNATFTLLVATLLGYVTNLIGADVQQNADVSGTINTKSLARDTLVASILKVAKAAFGYASSINNTMLKAASKVTESGLRTLNDVDLIAAGQNMYNVVNPVITSIADWGATAVDMSSLQTNISGLTTLVSAYESAKATTEEATKSIPELLDEAHTFMTEQMDSAMEQYKISNADFHTQYTITRGINTHGYRKTVVVHIHVLDISGHAVALADINLVSNGGIKRHRQSKADGSCIMTKLKPDTIQVTVSKPGYASVSKSDTVTSPQRIDFIFTMIATGGTGTVTPAGEQ